MKQYESNKMLLGYPVDQDGKEAAQPIASKYRGTPMTHIKLYRRGEGCEVPDGNDYLLVLARQVDIDGNWLPTDVRSFQSLCQLREALREIVATRDGIVIRGSSQFWQLAQELGLLVLTAEWGKL